jgi:hypothetical protein
MYEKLDIMKYFFEEPYRGFHIRELARMCKMNPMTIKSKLQGFLKENIIIIEKTNLYNQYKSNTESKQFKNMKLFYNLEKIRLSGLVEHLEKKLDYPTIILFGSFSRAEDTPKSDIDIAVISPVKDKIDISIFEKAVNREIQMLRFTDKEWKNLIISDSNLSGDIVSGITLSGFVEL